MNINEYSTMREAEDDFWWYVGFRKIYAALLDRYCLDAAKGAVLDAGCGTGAFLAFLFERYGPRRLTGLDFSDEALRFCRERGFEDLVQRSVEELPFDSGSFDLVVSLDVLCHRSIGDDMAPLREFKRALRDGGYLLLNLPAFMFIYSEHDLAVHTARRYRRREVEMKLEAAGLEPIFVTYTNCLLFPAVVASRLARKLLGSIDESQATSDLKLLPVPVNKMLSCALAVESRIVLLNRLPFGSSVTAIARAT
jgi:SAM-dependent methyltransferase